MGTPPLATAPHYDDPNTPRRWYRRPGVTVAAMVVVSLAIGIATWWGLDGNDDPAPAPTPPAANTTPASNGQQGYLPDTVDRYGHRLRVPANPAGQPLAQVSTKAPRGLNDPATGVQWQQIYTWGAAVFTASDGPTGITSQGVPVGIARTSQGSVIAASQINARVFYGPDEARRTAVTELVIGPPAALQLLLDTELPTRQAAAATYSHVDEQYTETFSRVSVATGPKQSSDYPSGQYFTVSTMTMVWDHGQWKWRIPDEGFSDATANVRLESVAGWTRW